MLNDTIVIITGGAGLLGQEFSRAVIEHGGVAIVADRDIARGEIFKASLPTVLQARVDVIDLEITSKSSLKNMIKTVDDKYGKIDALVNNAYPRNKNYGRCFFDVEYEDFCENLVLHLGGYFLVSQHLSRYFKIQGYGNIINLASIYGVIAPRFELYEDTSMTMPVEYAAIKAAIIQLTKYMAKYLKRTNVRVNCISPGGVFDHQPEKFLTKYNASCLSKGILDKKNLTGTLVFLLSGMSTHINGQNIIVDDGFSL